MPEEAHHKVSRLISFSNCNVLLHGIAYSRQPNVDSKMVVENVDNFACGGLVPSVNFQDFIVPLQMLDRSYF